MVRKRLLLGVLPIAFLLPTPALAQSAPGVLTTPTTTVCPISRGAICSGLGQDRRPAGPPETPSDGATEVAGRRPQRPSQPSPYVRERVFLPPVDGCINGRLYVDRILLRETGEVVRRAPNACLPNPVPPTSSPPSATGQTARPPAERLWREVPLPEPAWGLSPPEKGLTGLPTWLWDPRGGAPVTATVDLGGFTATATARPVKYVWTMWDRGDGPNSNPHPMLVSDVPGSEARPAATYTYETRGDFTVTQTVTWAGTYTFTGPGVNDVVDLGTTSISSTRTYHVVEVRGALKG